MNQSIEIPDSLLIGNYLSGSTTAFSILLERHKSKIFTTIFLLVKDRNLSEDIFQETFIKVLDKINSGNYKDEGKFIPWATRIAHNLCIDHFRKVKRSPTFVTSDDKDVFEFINYVEDSVEEKMIKQQRSVTLNLLLDHIPLDQREVIILRHFAGLSFKEISNIMDCSINTSLGRMRYGLANLRKIIDDKKVEL